MSLGYQELGSPGKGLFYDCPIENLYLGRNLGFPEESPSDVYGYSSFYGNTNLTAVIVGDEVTSIGDYAFSSCTGLTSVTIGKSIISIGGDAFSDCSSLTSITIPESVTSIGNTAFSGCTGLTSVEIPNSVTSIGDNAFTLCTGLTSVIINSNAIASKTYTNSSTLAEIFGEQVMNYVFGEGVKKISSYACCNCTSLSSVTIPSSMSSIGSSAFSNCSSLTSVHITDLAAWCGISFADASSNPLGWAHHLYLNGEEVKDLIISNSVTLIGDYVFNGCTGLISITIPNSVTSIGESAFFGCTNIKQLVLEDGDDVLSLGNVNMDGKYYGAFYSLPLVSVYLGRSLTYDNGSDSQPRSPFYEIPSLASVSIGSKVTSLGKNLFRNCTGIHEISIPNNVTSIGNHSFSACTGIKKLTIEEMPGIVYDGFDVTTGIETYTRRDEEWVWDKTKQAWYILNNQNEYEPYGAYATSLSTWYDGKLAIVDGHEWEYTGGKWNDLGEVEDTQVVEYIERNASNMGYIDLGVTFKENTRIQIKFYPTNAGGRAIIGDWSTNDSDDWRFFFSGSTLYYDFDNSRQSTSKGLNSTYEWEIGNYYIKDIGSSSTILNNTAHTDFSNRTHNLLLGTHVGLTNGDSGKDYERVYYVKIFEGETLVKDYVPYYDGSNYGLWDNVGNRPYMPTEGTWTGHHEGSLEYAKYYVAKDAPTILDDPLTIGDGSFSGCTAMTSCSFGNREISIGGSVFQGCTSLTECSLGSGVKTIGSYAFSGCSALPKIVIPQSIMSIGSGAFYNCSALRETHVDNLTAWCGIAFGGATANPLYLSRHMYMNGAEVKDLVIPSTVQDISNYAFTGGQGFSSILIPQSVTSIGNYSFQGCTGVSSVTIPGSVATVGNNAFSDCTEIKDLNIVGNGVTTIGSYAFSNCSALTSLEIGHKVATIGSSAFSGCTGLTTINIPNSVTTIGGSAFAGCTNLVDLGLGSSLTSVGSYAFGNSRIRQLLIKADTPPSSSLNVFSEQTYYQTTLYVPIGKKDDYAYSDSWYKFNTIKESATANAKAKSEYAYTLMEARTFQYAAYDAVNDRIKMVAATSVDENNPNHCWQTVEMSGRKFLYNIGAKKFAVPSTDGSSFRLSAEVGSISMEDGDDGIIIGGNTAQQWALVVDEKMDAYMGLEDVVATGVEEINVNDNANLNQKTQGVYDLSGRKVNVNVNDNVNNSKLKKGIYIVNGRKILIQR